MFLFILLNFLYSLSPRSTFTPYDPNSFDSALIECFIQKDLPLPRRYIPEADPLESEYYNQLTAPYAHDIIDCFDTASDSYVVPNKYDDGYRYMLLALPIYRRFSIPFQKVYKESRSFLSVNGGGGVLFNLFSSLLSSK